jgi:hypothetical protein
MAEAICAVRSSRGGRTMVIVAHRLSARGLNPFAQADSLTILGEYERDPSCDEAISALNRRGLLQPMARVAPNSGVARLAHEAARNVRHLRLESRPQKWRPRRHAPWHGGGHGFPIDRATAPHWFRAAAELGHGHAQLMLGRYLAGGANDAWRS